MNSGRDGACRVSVKPANGAKAYKLHVFTPAPEGRVNVTQRFSVGNL
jgi:hypothetical protein